jgi:hypothetical protein
VVESKRSRTIGIGIREVLAIVNRWRAAILAQTVDERVGTVLN